MMNETSPNAGKMESGEDSWGHWSYLKIPKIIVTDTIVIQIMDQMLKATKMNKFAIINKHNLLLGQIFLENSALIECNVYWLVGYLV